MTWNPPVSFSVSEVVTASKMNQIRESLLYLKGQAGAIIPEDVISPVRNDAASSYTLERTSATARKYGLLIGASGDFGIQDLTAGARRLTISASGGISAPGDAIFSGILSATNRVNVGSYFGSTVPIFGAGQANGMFVWVCVENITGSTATLATGVAQGVSGNISAFGSSSGWDNRNNANRALSLGAGTIVGFGSGSTEFVVELTAGGVVQARRNSGSQTWAVSALLHLR